jgi:hypothetical protein
LRHDRHPISRDLDFGAPTPHADLDRRLWAIRHPQQSVPERDADRPRSFPSTEIGIEVRDRARSIESAQLVIGVDVKGRTRAPSC